MTKDAAKCPSCSRYVGTYLSKVSGTWLFRRHNTNVGPFGNYYDKGKKCPKSGEPVP